MRAVLDVSSDVTAGAWMTLVIPVAVAAILMLCGWRLRKRAG